MPLYHTMGIHSLARDAPRRRLLRPAGALGPGRGAAPDRGGADHVALPRSDALPRPRPATRGSASTTSRRVRALGYAGAAMTSTARRALRSRSSSPRCSSTTTARPRSTRSRSARDQAAKPGCAGRPARQRAAQARAERRDLRAPLGRRGVRRLLEPARRRREGDSRRLVPHGRHRAPRRGRRPLGRRPGRRHDHLRRREHPSARGRGRARAAIPACARWRSSARRTTVSASGSSRSSSATPRAEELDAHCLASTLARFKRPREYRLRAELPKSPSGKILRRVLRDEPKESA